MATALIQLILFITFGFGIGITPLPAFATNTELAVKSQACSCDLNQKDSYEGPSQIAFGAFNGQCFDTCRFRRSIVLGAHPQEPKTQKTVITNFMHEGKYWKAQIPLTSVDRVEVGFEEFMTGIFHVFLLFHFSQSTPVVLESQVKNQSSRELVSNLVISPEGIPPRDGKYNLFDAFMERYPVGLRTLSKQQVIQWSVDTLKHKVRVFDLNLTAHQRQKLLRTALSTVDTLSFRTKYRLLTNNCATSVLDLVDSVVKPNEIPHANYLNVFYNIERALPIAGPIGTFQVFLNRKLISENSGRSILD